MLYEVITDFAEESAAQAGLAGAEGHQVRGQVEVQDFMDLQQAVVCLVRFQFQPGEQRLELVDRITSYNVCYTKLLRVDVLIHIAFVASRQRI